VRAAQQVAYLALVREISAKRLWAGTTLMAAAVNNVPRAVRVVGSPAMNIDAIRTAFAREIRFEDDMRGVIALQALGVRRVRRQDARACPRVDARRGPAAQV